MARGFREEFFEVPEAPVAHEYAEAVRARLQSAITTAVERLTTSVGVEASDATAQPIPITSAEGEL